MSPLIAIVSIATLADLAVKSIVVMVVALVMAVLLFRASAAWRHLAWTLGVVGLLLLPALSIGLPAWRVPWIPGWMDAEVSIARAPLTPSIPAGEFAPQEAVRSTGTLVEVVPINRIDREVASQPLSTNSKIKAVRPHVSWLALILPAWLVGAALALAPLAVGLWQLRCLRRGSSVVTNADWLSLLKSVQQQLGVRQPVRLERSELATMPLTWGAWRPVLLLPAEADDWSPARQRMVLLHELAHIRRFDWLTQMLAHVATAAYWFNPLVWLAARQMRIERERACDDLVLAAGAKASDYAQELLEMAAGLADPRLATLAAVPMARRGVLEGRLRAILDSRQSRAAITTAAVLLASAIAGAAIAPLAMLRASQPKEPSAEKPLAEKPLPDKPTIEKPAPAPAKPVIPRSPTAEEIEARTSGIRISVLNSKGDQGIPEFRVIAGVPAPGIADEYEKRTGRTVVNWQPHTLRIGKDGDYTWPLAKAYDVMAIRVEADGYQPQIWTWAKKADGVQHIVFQLTPDKGVAGRVFSSNGKPAVGATVALALPQKDAVLEDGKLRGEGDPPAEKPGDRWRRPTMVKTDAEGRFKLPTEFEPAAVLILHESGVRELPYETFQKSPEITLDRWGSIDGRVLWGDKPGAIEEVSLSIHRDEYGYPGMIASYATAQTDAEGRFRFERVLPGRVQISRPIRPTEPSKAGFTAINLDGMLSHPVVKPGEPTPALIGGQGRTLTGKLEGLESWKGVTFHIHPNAPHFGFSGDDEIWAAFGQLKASPIGPILFRDKQPVNEDGTFEIKNVLPGNYQLFVSAQGFANYAASTKVRVEAETPGQAPPAQDLGVITIKKPLEPVKPADGAATEKEAAKPAAEVPVNKTVSIRGKVVDDETGLPIERLITQAGKFDPADPTKVTWGYSEGRSSAKDGSFSTTIRWAEGWTARILADGYVPQPVIAAAPPADKDEIEVTIRLKRGRLVRGVVLDHEGQPVKGAAVFAVGPTGLNLSAGKAWTSWGESDNEAKPVITDDTGRFELPAGEAKVVAVSHASFDVWPTAIAAEGETKVLLPKPARVDVVLDIDGADKESKVFYQLLSHLTPEFAGIQSSREFPITNGGNLSLPALPPGKYQICRQLMHRLADFGTGAMLDREFFEIKAGETKTIRWVRDKGARLDGKVILPAETPLAGIIVSVRSEKAEKGPFDNHEWQTTYASLTAAADGTYRTERIAPGSYLLVAEAYKPLTPEAQRSTGVIGPAFRAEIKIEVPAEGTVSSPDLVLKEFRR